MTISSFFLTLRGIIGPLPTFICTTSYFIMKVTGITLCMGIFAAKATKFAFIAVFQTIPIMNDNLISFIICSNISMIALYCCIIDTFFLEQGSTNFEVIQINVNCIYCAIPY